METHSRVRRFSLLTAIFILTQINVSTADIKIKEKTFVNKIIDLNEANWKEMLEDEWLVEFQAPWCPACKSLEGTWKELASWSTNLRINVGQVDITSSPGLSGRFIVTALPTIYHVINGEFRQYKGTRDRDSLIAFIENKVWKKVEPLPGWRSPDTLLMTFVSGFFKLSQVLRQVHNTLMEEYGLPSWGSYLIFALTIIFTAGLFGVLLVCCIDIISPKYTSLPPKQEEKTKSNKEKDSDAEEVETDESEIRDDDLVDVETLEEIDEQNKSIIEAEKSEEKAESEEQKEKVEEHSNIETPTEGTDLKQRKVYSNF